MMGGPAEPKLENMQTLWQVVKLLNSSLNLKKVLEMALDQAMKVVDAEAGTLWLINAEEPDILEPVIAKGPKADGLKGFRLKVGEGMAGWVTEHRTSQFVMDVQNDERWSQKYDQKSGFVTRSLLCVPLITQTDCIGCLQLINKLGDKLFDENDLELCESLSGVIAVAIENGRLYTDLQMMLTGILQTLSSAIDARDPYTQGHSQRVSEYSVVIGKALKMSANGLEILQRAALLHDVGKIGVRDHVLLKQGPLNDEEYAAMKEHPRFGEKILADINPKRLVEDLRIGASYHHERYDGRGYPYNIAEEEIPLIARIIAIGDAYDAMTSDRPYRKALPKAIALEEIGRNKGSQFDPALADLFIEEMQKEV